tara:strand:+ start:1119 stop:2087 length:969 start_codon:yes stop_codon:yes gene_type:complete
MKHLNRIFPDLPRDKNKLPLDRNECNCLETKKLIKSIHDNISTDVLSTYPSLDPVYNKLSEYLNVEKNFLYLTCGADGAIKQFFEHNRGCTALLMRPTYGMNEVYAHYYCKDIIFIDYHDLKVDLRSIRVGISKLSKGDIFILASPDSPVGVQYTKKDLLYIADLCRWQQVKVLFDETYILYGDRQDTMLPHVDDTISTCSSFSKSLGLAGVRLGYLVCNDISIKDNKPMREIGDYQTSILDGALDNMDKFIPLIDNQISLRNKIATYDGFTNTSCNFVHVHKSKVDNIDRIAYLREINHPCLKDTKRMTLPDKSCLQNIVG